MVFNLKERILIAALGNPLRTDDGIGSVIVDRIRNETCLPENVTCCELTGSQLLSELFETVFDDVFVIDAADFGGNPGEWVRLCTSEEEFRFSNRPGAISLHHLNLPEIISLLDALQEKIPRMIIYGIQPQDIGYSGSISAVVTDAIPGLCRVITNEVLGLISESR